MSAPSEKHTDGSLYEDVLIEGHDYDGIQEYDNPMPGWWLWIFVATIVWSIFYIAALGMGYIDGYQDQLAKEERALNQVRLAAAVSAPVIDAETLAAAMNDPTLIELGQNTFARSCAACHGADGSGGIGPALNDNNWIYGGDTVSVYRSIREGIPANGMPAHGHFTDDQVTGLVAFIKTELDQ